MGTSRSGGSQMKVKVSLAVAPACLQRLLGAGDSLWASFWHQERLWRFLGTFLWGGNSRTSLEFLSSLPRGPSTQGSPRLPGRCRHFPSFAQKKQGEERARPWAAVILQQERALCIPSPGQEGEAGGGRLPGD